MNEHFTVVGAKVRQEDLLRTADRSRQAAELPRRPMLLTSVFRSVARSLRIRRPALEAKVGAPVAKARAVKDA